MENLFSLHNRYTLGSVSSMLDELQAFPKHELVLLMNKDYHLKDGYYHVKSGQPTLTINHLKLNIKFTYRTVSCKGEFNRTYGVFTVNGFDNHNVGTGKIKRVETTADKFFGHYFNDSKNDKVIITLSMFALFNPTIKDVIAALHKQAFPEINNVEFSFYPAEDENKMLNSIFRKLTSIYLLGSSDRFEDAAHYEFAYQIERLAFVLSQKPHVIMKCDNKALVYKLMSEVGVCLLHHTKSLRIFKFTSSGKEVILAFIREVLVAYLVHDTTLYDRPRNRIEIHKDLLNYPYLLLAGDKVISEKVGKSYTKYNPQSGEDLVNEFLKFDVIENIEVNKNGNTETN